MSAHHSSFGGSHDDPEVLAVLDALEGRGVRPRGATPEIADHLVDQFEAAAGALFAAWPRKGEAPTPAPGFQERLERFVLGKVAGQAPSPSMDEQAQSSNRVRKETLRMATKQPHADVGPTKSWGLVTAAGWVAAAGLLVFVLWESDGQGAQSAGPDPGTVRQQFDAFVAAGHLLDPWESADVTLDVHGGVAWDDQTNEGFLQIEGLAVNDPKAEQYQLWIFRSGDPKAELHPVDGGVFDVPDSGEVLVAIDAKLKVGHASLFAVTVEKPGGVVVSDRKRLPIFAKSAS